MPKSEGLRRIVEGGFAQDLLVLAHQETPPKGRYPRFDRFEGADALSGQSWTRDEAVQADSTVGRPWWMLTTQRESLLVYFNRNFIESLELPNI